MLDTSQFIKKRAHSFKVYCMCSTLTLRISHSFMQSTSNNSKSTHAGSKMESTHNFSFGVFFFCVFVIIITTDTTITTTNNNNYYYYKLFSLVDEYYYHTLNSSLFPQLIQVVGRLFQNDHPLTILRDTIILPCA